MLRGVAILTRALAGVAATLFAAASAMLAWEVAARYFFNAPTIWAAELSQLCLIWGCLLASPWLLAVRRHIAVDAVVALLPMGVVRWTETLAMAAVAGFSGVVAWYGWGLFADSFARGRTTGSMLDLPVWVSELAVPVGFGLLALQGVIEACRAALGTVPTPDHARDPGP